MITVREALDLPELSSSRVIAGHGGLDRVIRSVTVMDTPDIARWLRGGELLLCNVYVIRNDVERQVALVSDAARCDVAALGVKTRRFVEGLPEDMLTRADSLDLPLIEIPEEYAWVDVMNPVLTHIINEQYCRLLKSSQMHRLFTQLALEGKGLPHITEALGRTMESPVAMIDAAMEVLHCYPPGWLDEGATRALADLGGLLAPAEGAGNVTVLPPERTGLARPVLASTIARAGERYGHILCLSDRESLLPEQLMAMEHAATVATLEMLKQRAVDHVRRSFRNDFLYDLLTGKLRSETAVRSRARELGWKLDSAYGVFTMEVEDPGGDEPGQGRLEAIKDSLFYACKRAVRPAVPSGMLMQIGGTVTVLVPASRPGEEARILDIAHDVKAHLENTFGGLTVTAGVGRTCPTTHLPRSYREAGRALQLGRMVWGKGAVTHYDNLGVFRILSSANPQELSSFVAEFLGPIMGGATRGGSGLLGTLEKYFECNESIPDTARALYVHPNTVRYRLRRIEDLTGLSLSRNRHRINLEMALKIHRFLGAGEEDV